jgi:hypothetical protein
MKNLASTTEHNIQLLTIKLVLGLPIKKPSSCVEQWRV